MLAFLWRLLWAWRAWRALNRDGRATRLLGKGWDLHANRWVPGGSGALSRAWVAAEAAMPLGWRLMALVRDSDTDAWLATAAGPVDGQTVHGRGGRPERALQRLAEELGRIHGAVTG
jgi:hypothetical protein